MPRDACLREIISTPFPQCGVGSSTRQSEQNISGSIDTAENMGLSQSHKHACCEMILTDPVVVMSGVVEKILFKLEDPVPVI